MIIANPIYDTIFKYLMENKEIAKGIISAIIGETIEHIEVQAQEQTKRVGPREGDVSVVGEPLTFYRLDFIAKIKQKNGEHKLVLVELQKSSSRSDLIRFRNYLGEQYRRKDDSPIKKKEVLESPLPIITIYILGYYLSPTLPAVIKVNRQYIDVLEGQIISEKNEFIECLTHDSYVIQVPALHLKMKTKLEYVLSIFMQENFIMGNNHLKNYVYDPDDKLMKKILKKLSYAAADSKLLKDLEFEELCLLEYELSIGQLKESIAEKDKVIEENRKALNEKDKLIAELLAKVGETEKISD